MDLIGVMNVDIESFYNKIGVLELYNQYIFKFSFEEKKKKEKFMCICGYVNYICIKVQKGMLES